MRTTTSHSPISLVKVSDLTPNQRITYAYYANRGFSRSEGIRMALRESS